jgi:hypothetical protein
LWRVVVGSINPPRNLTEARAGRLNNDDGQSALCCNCGTFVVRDDRDRSVRSRVCGELCSVPISATDGDKHVSGLYFPGHHGQPGNFNTTHVSNRAKS